MCIRDRYQRRVREHRVRNMSAAENFGIIDADGGGTLDFEELAVFVAFVSKKAVVDLTDDDNKAVLGDDEDKEFDQDGFVALCAEKGIDQGELSAFLKAQ
eukprot:TRINITY_DN635_c0_g1_i1.p1 TRINITY_DN635_c0_g1~~TRINITY_DN635_c0_g1_i1.p1  ORF type:complete len:100 (+),score=41.64 TRINITY_DN635_c0_g1_i1:73-372(+)